MKRPYELTVIFRHGGRLQVPEILSELHAIRPELASCSAALDGWLLKGNTKEEAFLYEVFGPTGATAAATAVLTEGLKQAVDPRIVSMWNGREGREGASLQYVGRPSPETSTLVLRAKPEAFTERSAPAADLLLKAASLWSPAVASLETTAYFDKKVFKDRPGVGWMLYLPTALTVQQVPEARSLVRVMAKDDKGKERQTGTIVVSIIDEPFSDENPEHVKMANAIEVRLVDQDLLPRYAEL